MNHLTELTLKLLGLTIGFAALFVVFTMGSSIIFQGHMHPDDWSHTWHDTVWMFLLGITYIFFIIKLAKLTLIKKA